MLRDLGAAVHFVRRRWRFTAVAAVTLGMGIAANVSVFALVRSILFTTAPYRAAHELFQLIPADHMAGSPFGEGDLHTIGLIPGIVRVAGCAAPRLPTLRTHPALRVAATEVSRDFFSVFDATPHLGRTLQPSDFEPGVRHAVVSFAVWDAILGRAPDAVGQRIRLDGHTFTVVGVMPPTFAPSCFDGGVRRQAWIPIATTGRSTASDAGLAVVARVDATEPLPAVQARLDAYGMRRSDATGHPSYAGMFLQQLGQKREREARPGLIVLQSLAACLLLIACADVGSLFLLDASRRDSELLTRTFLGASPRRLIRQLLLESTAIAIIGGALGAAASLDQPSIVRRS